MLPIYKPKALKHLIVKRPIKSTRQNKENDWLRVFVGVRAGELENFMSPRRECWSE